jgi:TolB-like protein/tetratricopeptide (TPR) repeat protein
MSESPVPTQSGPASDAAPVAQPLRGIWERIKQHKVVQWTLAYLALAYTLLHGAGMLRESLGWPHAALRLFTLLLILGIPVVITVAWYHGAFARRRVSGTEIMIIALLLAIGGALLWRDHQSEHGATRAEEGSPIEAPAASIAVLPFADLSPEGNQEYFSAGMAEEILNVLAHVSGLKVASRTSSFQFRKSDLGIPAIAQKLGVRNILEGSVRKAGDTVRITAQLVDAATDKHLWSQDFDRPLTTANLFGIQDEIAAAIVDRLAATIGPAAKVGKPVLPQADTANVDVYDLYLKGHELFLARSKPSLSEAARVLKAAVDKDPKFARAWESLAAVMAISGFWGLKEEPDYTQAALEAADQALRLDPKLSLAYAVRGEVQINRLAALGQGSWDEAFAQFTEAIARDVQNATARLWRGSAYFNLGYFDRAHEDLEHCLELDPAYEICRRTLAQLELTMGNPAQGLRLYEQGMAVNFAADDGFFAPAAAARGDRLGTLGTLLQQYRAKPALVQALFRALTDPAFSERDRQEAIALINTHGDPDAALAALWILKAYDQMNGIVTDGPVVIWNRSDPGWLKSPARRQMIQHWLIPQYWRAHGFPPQCQPVGSADFACP